MHIEHKEELIPRAYTIENFDEGESCFRHGGSLLLRNFLIIAGAQLAAGVAPKARTAVQIGNIVLSVAYLSATIYQRNIALKSAKNPGPDDFTRRKFEHRSLGVCGLKFLLFSGNIGLTIFSMVSNNFYE